jgi:hypothetical protein
MSKRISLIIFTLLFIIACDDDSSSNDNSKKTLKLNFTNLTELQNGFHYEGWAIISGNAVSTGKFNFKAGKIVDLSDNEIANGEFATSTDLSAAVKIVISIEANGDIDALPSNTKYLAGPVANNSSSLSVSDDAALGNDFSSISGKYILATPTTADTTDETSGIWFLDNSSGSAVAGLTLPVLPAGWQYEGWVVDGSPLTTGRFTSVSGTDLGSPFSTGGPMFPGEDFVANAPTSFTFPLELSGKTVVISIEPETDDSSAPFALKPLLGTVPAQAVSGTVYTIASNITGFATGTATIK